MNHLPLSRDIKSMIFQYLTISSEQVKINYSKTIRLNIWWTVFYKKLLSQAKRTMKNKNEICINKDDQTFITITDIYEDQCGCYQCKIRYPQFTIKGMMRRYDLDVICEYDADIKPELCICKRNGKHYSEIDEPSEGYVSRNEILFKGFVKHFTMYLYHVYINKLE
jgi:hypothetical protein